MIDPAATDPAATAVAAPPGSAWGTSATHRAWLDDQFARLIQFAQGAQLDSGGFGYLNSDGTVDPARSLELFITCRMTHVAAIAHLRGIPGAGPMVDHGLAAITQLFADAEHGGWFSALTPERSPIPGRKAAYDHAFVLLASASATAAGRPGARELFDQAAAIVAEKFWDDDAGLSRESFAPDFSDSEDYRGANSNMHLIEAFLAAGDVSGDPVWHQRALSIADRLANQHARSLGWFLPEHFDADWNPLLDYNADDKAHPFRPFGSTIGHWLEWARLMVQIQASIANPPEWLGEVAAALFDHAVTTGWAADGTEGFVYTVDFAGAVVVDTRMHWAVCEGIAAAGALRAATGEARYEHWYRVLWDHAARYFLEPARGTWVHEVSADLVESGLVWPGRPDAYHAVNAVLIPQLPLAPSAAVALA